jgi:hypothetical protein
MERSLLTECRTDVDMIINKELDRDHRSRLGADSLGGDGTASRAHGDSGGVIKSLIHISASGAMDKGIGENELTEVLTSS